jgi:anti-sigma regulatory factor (Ser/Thr protein kinase)
MEPLTVPAALGSLQASADYVADAAASAGLDEKTAYRLHLAVDEITTNIIAHGYGDSGLSGSLDLLIEIDDQALTITIEDTGHQYDPANYQRPDDLDLPPDQRKVGGLGVFLAMRSVDRFEYEQVGDRNRHTLVLKR